MGEAAELFNVVDGVVGRNAHDGAHFIAAAIVFRTVALAADVILLLKDRIVLVTLLLQVHSGGKSRGARADDADLCILADF